MRSWAIRRAALRGRAWYKGQPVYYFDFGVTRSGTASMMEFAREAPAAGGQPTLLEGQAPTAASVPGDSDYTDFWRVTVGVVDLRSYVLGSYRDHRRAMDDADRGRLTIRRARGALNRPVTYVDGQPVARRGALRILAGALTDSQAGMSAVATSVASLPQTLSASHYAGMAGRIDVAVPRLEGAVDIDGC